MTRIAIALLFLSSLPSFGWNPEEQPNVNSRYTVESVHVSGKRTSRLTENMRRELETVVGTKLDHGLLDRMATEIKRELRVEGVSVHVAKGSLPGQVAVEFLAEGGRRQDFDINIPKGVYQSRQGWSGGIETHTAFGQNEVALGVINDGDSGVDRFAGLKARYERNSLGTSRIKMRVEFDSYHDQWNSSTLAAAARSHFSPDLYRSRQHVEPSVTVVLAEPLTLTVGVSMDVLDSQSYGLGAARSSGITLASAAGGALRFHERWTGDMNQDLDAGYSIRSAGAALASDATYTRHALNLGYHIERGHSTVAINVLAGRITGDAPLYDRFVLGNSITLRGWNKYDLDPLGGDRVMHASVDYSYRWLRVFYDAGAIWDAHTAVDPKQSAGAGIGRAGKDGFLVAAAFPLRAGHIEPMFIVGFNF